MSKKIKNIAAYFLLIIIIFNLSFYPFYPARASGYILKEFVLDPALRLIANKILNKITNNTIKNILSSGRGGDSAFIGDWRNFILQGQYRGEDIWRAIVANAIDKKLLCKHIRESKIFKSMFQPVSNEGIIAQISNRIRIEALQQYRVAVLCDPVLEARVDDFFNKGFVEGGGWDTWERLLEPKNNIYGVMGITLDELSRQRSLEESTDIKEGQSSAGFLGKRVCVVRGISGACAIWSNIKTPGRTFEKSISELINQNLAWLTGSDEINEILNLIMGSLMNRIFSGLDTGGVLFPEDVSNPVTPPPEPVIRCEPVLDPVTGEPTGEQTCQPVQ